MPAFEALNEGACEYRSAISQFYYSLLLARKDEEAEGGRIVPVAPMCGLEAFRQDNLIHHEFCESFPTPDVEGHMVRVVNPLPLFNCGSDDEHLIVLICPASCFAPPF